MIKRDVYILLCSLSIISIYRLQAMNEDDMLSMIGTEEYSATPQTNTEQLSTQNTQPTTLPAIQQTPPDMSNNSAQQPPQYASSSATSIAQGQQPAATVSTTSWSVDSEEQKGNITTSIDDASGNWFVKKTLVKKARLLYTQIRDIKEKISKQKDVFIEQRTTLNNTLNDFYVNFSFDIDAIDTILDKLENQIKEVQSQTKQAATLEPTDIDNLIKKRETLAQLKKSIVSIKDLDESFDKGLEVFFKQEELSRSYEQGAWNNYRAMEELLSDIKAEELYWQIQSALENVQANYTYAYNDFAQYVQKTIQTINQAMQQVKTSLEDLKKQGIVLAEEIEAQEKAKKEAELAAIEQAKAAKEPKVKKAPVRNASWFSSIHNWFSKTF